jgi:GYF domain 2
MNYQINRGGQQSGPYSLGDLQSMMAGGQIAPGDLAWCEGMPAWLPVSHLVGSHPAAPVWPGAQAVAQRPEAAGYAQVCGILGLILAIVGFCIPIVGVLFITPLAIIFGALALYGHYKGMGIAILIINVVNLMVSPTFWLNIGAGATIQGASGNRFLTYFDAIGTVVMLALVLRKRTS